MRRYLQILTFLTALAAPCGMAQAQTLTAAKMDSINKAADALVALAKDSYSTGKPPRYSDPAAKPLLDTVFNTKDLEGKKPLAWEAIPLLQDWYKATQKVGTIYYLAGTGSPDVAVVSKDPKMILRANSNTAVFHPEFGLYYDAQMRIQTAALEAATVQLTNPSEEQRKDPAFRAALGRISNDTEKAMIGLLGTLLIPGMPTDWQLLRVVSLLDIAPKAARFMAPNDIEAVKNAALEVAEKTENPDVKSGLNAVARLFQPF